MKKLKQLVLGMLSATFLTVGLFACSNDEVNNMQNETTDITTELKTKTGSDVLIAQDQSGSTTPVFLFDSNLMKRDLVSQGIFAEVESIEIGENLLTIIGKNINTFDLVAFQVELVKIGDKYYFPNPDNPNLPITTFASHECNGVDCSSCAFEYALKPNGKPSGKIIGCKCNVVGICNHKITDKDQSDKNKETAKTFIDIIKLFL